MSASEPAGSSESDPRAQPESVDVGDLLVRCMNDPAFSDLILKMFAGDAAERNRFAHRTKAARELAEKVRDVTERLESLAAEDFTAAQAIVEQLKKEVDRCVTFVPTVNVASKKK